MRFLLPLPAIIPAPILAAAFERPVPEGATTGTAALSFAVASVALVLALGAAQWLAWRRLAGAPAGGSWPRSIPSRPGRRR